MTKLTFSSVSPSSERIVKTVPLVVVVLALAGAQNLALCVVIETKRLNSFYGEDLIYIHTTSPHSRTLILLIRRPFFGFSLTNTFIY